MGIEEDYQRMVEQKRMAEAAAKVVGTPPWAVAGGVYMGAGAATVTTVSHSHLLDEARSKLAIAESKVAVLQLERHQLADKLDEATTENARLAARLAGVIEMLRDQGDEKLSEAIWLLEKIELQWSAAVKPDEGGGSEEYIPF